MQWPTFKTKLRKALESNTILGLVCLGLLFVAVLQQIKINSQHERIALRPPGALSEEVIIGWDHASQEYLNSFALYIVGSMSSATPNTVDYTAKVMEPLFDPQLWQVIKPQLLAVKNNPNYIGINPVSNFTPTANLIYEPKTGKIFIPGRIVSSAYSKGAMTQLGAVDVTYEVIIQMVDGMPRVKSWYVYPGEPHTLKWADRYPDKAEQEAKDRQAQIQILPTVPESEISFPQDAQPVPQPGTASAAAAPIPASGIPITPGQGNIPGVVMPPSATETTQPAETETAPPAGQSQSDLL